MTRTRTYNFIVCISNSTGRTFHRFRYEREATSFARKHKALYVERIITHSIREVTYL